ncbi:hypothetical protein ASE39_08570 [Acidovorax sp. Root267]|nr:hypothetical protein ASE39_08570 [Acidovorax sp. Root267]
MIQIRTYLTAWLTLSLLPLSSVQAQDNKASLLAELSIEELANIQITSAARHPEFLGDASAAIFVITSDSIRRSGAATLPEALRLAPNLQVARLDASQYAISARGFNNAIGNKLLVLIDGRTVYTPFFSGVFWDQQDVMLEDVDRIEVISGPGATLWGANAVNGVINVITKSSAHTQGGLLVVGAGNQGREASFRYGGVLGEGATFRVYAKGDVTRPVVSIGNAAATDGRSRGQLGWRADWADKNTELTLQGDVYEGATDNRGFFGRFDIGRVEASGANILGRLTRKLEAGQDVRLQAYYDYTDRKDAFLYQPRQRVLDVEFQHGVPLESHRLLWGGGYRQASDVIRPGVIFGFAPAQASLHWANLFVQDEFKVTEHLNLTVGTKLERNDFTGMESLPSARFEWKPSPHQLWWGAVSRAVRAPARLDRDIRLPPNPPFIIAGGPDFESEVAKVLELGYRSQPSSTLSYSVTAFQHHWDKLRSGQRAPGAQVQNMIEGKTWGLEAWGEWHAARNLRLAGGLSVLRKNLRVMPGSTDPEGPRALGNDPGHQWMLRAGFNLPHRQELDVIVRRVGALPDPAVPAYTAVDVRFGWTVRPGVEFSIVGQNLFDGAHPEFNAPMNRKEIPRNVALRIRWTL